MLQIKKRVINCGEIIGNLITKMTETITKVKENESQVNVASFDINDLLRAGVHYGHRVGARNPKMKHFIYSKSNGVHVIDLRKTMYYMNRALKMLFESAKHGKRILFVSTNAKFEQIIIDIANKCNQYYVCQWKGGMLTNWRTIVSSIKTLKKYNALLEKMNANEESQRVTKKEMLKTQLQRDKLDRSFGGIVNMTGMPDLVVVFSVKDEKLAIAESHCVGIPVVGIVDTNATPLNVTHPIPGNDDSIKAVEFYSKLFVEAVEAGMKEWGAKIDKSAPTKPEGQASGYKKYNSDKNVIKYNLVFFNRRNSN
jgi:small subunit ribosomal protein S2